MTNTKNLSNHLALALIARGVRYVNVSPAGTVFAEGFAIVSTFTGRVYMQDVHDKDLGRVSLGTCEDTADTLAEMFVGAKDTFRL